MNNQGSIIALAFVFLMGIVLAIVILAIERIRNKNANFNADSARKLSKEWNWRDKAQMNRIERKIKRRCKRGETELVLITTPKPRVEELLKSKGYKVTMGDPFGAVIDW